MEIRRYKSVDLRQISRLFYETVHAVNIKDYTKEQINAWATGRIDLKEWDASFQRHITYVVTENDLVVGFGDIDSSKTKPKWNASAFTLRLRQNLFSKGAATESSSDRRSKDKAYF